MKQISTFGSSSYRISDLQLLRNSDDDAVIAKLLAHCPIMLLDADEAIAESNRARLYILLRGALWVASDTRSGMADGTISKLMLARGSGLPAYDEAVLAAAAHCIYIPALRDGKPVAVPATWDIVRAPGSLRP